MRTPSKGLTVFSWALYDFSNAIFGMNILAFSFALYITVEKGAQDIVYGMALGISMFLASISMPILGAISDRKKKKMPYLIFFTLMCVLFLAFMGMVESLFLGLIFFALSNFGYLISGAVFYNALLPHVADKKELGKVSSYGISLSYLGTIIGLLIIRPFTLKYGYQASFIPTALFFVLFALPCFLFVKDKEIIKKEKDKALFIKGAFQGLLSTLKEIRRESALSSYFLGIFIILNAVNTVFIFMSVYLKKVFQFLDSEIVSLYMLAAVFSIIGAFLAGFLVDRIGSRRTLSGAVFLCCIGLLMAVFAFNKAFLWAIGPMVGMAFSGVRVSGRALAVELFPKERLGEIFGLLGFFSNLAFIGFLIWGLIVFIFTPLGMIKYRLALFISFLVLTMGARVLQRTRRVI